MNKEINKELSKQGILLLLLVITLSVAAIVIIFTLSGDVRENLSHNQCLIDIATERCIYNYGSFDGIHSDSVSMDSIASFSCSKRGFSHKNYYHFTKNDWDKCVRNSR